MLEKNERKNERWRSEDWRENDRWRNERENPVTRDYYHRVNRDFQQ